MSSETGLPEEACGIGQLPREEQSDDAEPFGQGGLPETGSDARRDALMEAEVIADTACTPGDAFLVKDAGTPTIPEIHAQELRDRLEVVVIHEGFRGEYERPAPMTPTVAQVAVLGGREWEIEVESAQFEEVGSAAGDVVAGEKSRGAARWVEVLVDEVEDELVDAGLAVRVGAIPGLAADQGMRMAFDSAGHVLDPIRRWHAVVVGEEEDLRLAGTGSELAGPCGSGLLLVGDSELEGWREAPRVDRERLRAAVIHQQHFKQGMIQGLPAEGRQASGCGLGATPAGNDDLNAQTGVKKLPEVRGRSRWSVAIRRPGGGEVSRLSGSIGVWP